MADRQATVIWEGTLTEGNGTISTGSGAISNTPVTWASRVEAPGGKTSPEELLAAAEAECYTMVLSNMLAKQNTPSARLSVTATCTVERVPTGLKITTMRLDVTGEVDGVDEESFRRLAQEAEAACPVSNALRGNVEISVEASLKESVSA
jgi:osmotically inducible protein OsmC